MDVFEASDAITARQAAELYGLKIREMVWPSLPSRQDSEHEAG